MTHLSSLAEKNFHTSPHLHPTFKWRRGYLWVTDSCRSWGWQDVFEMHLPRSQMAELFRHDWQEGCNYSIFSHRIRPNMSKWHFLYHLNGNLWITCTMKPVRSDNIHVCVEIMALKAIAFESFTSLMKIKQAGRVHVIWSCLGEAACSSLPKVIPISCVPQNR